MELISDILLVAGALGAGLYCFVLARRLKRFNDLEQGVGGAVAVLSAQVEELKQSLESARESSEASNAALGGLTERAEKVAHRLELLMASMHDVAPSPASAAEAERPAPAGTGQTDAAGADASGPIFMRHAHRRKEEIA